MIWRLLFWLAAGFHWAVGLPLLFFPKVMQTIVGSVALGDLTIDRVIGWLLICQGIVFVAFASDLPRYRPLIWIVMLSKAGTAALFIQASMHGSMSLKPPGLVLGDFGFAVLFLIFLLFAPKRDLRKPVAV